MALGGQCVVGDGRHETGGGLTGLVAPGEPDSTRTVNNDHREPVRIRYRGDRLVVTGARHLDATIKQADGNQFTRRCSAPNCVTRFIEVQAAPIKSVPGRNRPLEHRPLLDVTIGASLSHLQACDNRP